MHRLPLLHTGLWLLTLLAVLGLARTLAPGTYTLTPESRLWIEGTSSVHDWTCDVEAFEGTIEAEFAEALPASLAATRVAVPVREIECHKGTMNRKTYDALQADAHPTIAYTLLTATLTPSATDGATGGFTATTSGRLSLAGVEKTVAMTVEGQRLGDGRVRLAGSLPLRMTDFGIKPPTALLGTLKTGDDVTVHFDVYVAQ